MLISLKSKSTYMWCFMFFLKRFIEYLLMYRVEERRADRQVPFVGDEPGHD